MVSARREKVGGGGGGGGYKKRAVLLSLPSPHSTPRLIVPFQVDIPERVPLLRVSAVCTGCSVSARLQTFRS